MKHLPLSAAGALLLAGSMSTYSLAQQQLKEPKEPNAAVEQGQGTNKDSRQEKPKSMEGKANEPAAGEKAQKSTSGPADDKAKNAQRDEPDGKAGGKTSDDAGKQPGRNQAGSDRGSAGSQAKEAERSQQGGGDGKGKQRHAGKKLEPKQRTVVKETIVKRNVRPVQVNFSINVGSAIPRSVVLYDLPPVLIEYEPSYSRYKFIMTDDDTILVIDPDTWTIIDIIEV